MRKNSLILRSGWIIEYLFFYKLLRQAPEPSITQSTHPKINIRYTVGRTSPNMLQHSFLHCDSSGMLGADSSRNAAHQWWRWCFLIKVKKSTARQRAGKGQQTREEVGDFRQQFRAEICWALQEGMGDWRNHRTKGALVMATTNSLWKQIRNEFWPMERLPEKLMSQEMEWIRMKRILHFYYKSGPKRGRKHRSLLSTRLYRMCGEEKRKGHSQKRLVVRAPCVYL